MATRTPPARSGRTPVRRILGLSTALALSAGALTAPPAVAAPPPAPAGLSEAAARAAAVSSGQRVEATALTSETSRVFANPNGTFTLEQFPVPVRVRRDGRWVSVDTTLHANPDGTVTPVAGSLDIVLSGGGAGPLLRLRRDGRELALSWPGRLPTPVLVGDAATYPEVLPGVDLVVRAGEVNVSQVLVVKSAAAAANPALAELRFGSTTKGLRVRGGNDGGLAAVDSAGRSVFEAPAPLMWDSSPATGAATAAGKATAADRLTAPGGKVRQIGVRLDRGGLAVLPDRSVLAGSDTTYPVYIDPSWSGTSLAWTQVWSNYPTTSFYNGANLGTSEKVARVGYDSTDGKLTRSFFRFDTSGVLNKYIVKATLQTYETHSWSCTAREVQAWETGGISSSTTWNSQPTWIAMLDKQSIAKGYSSSCPAGGVEFNVTAHVQKAVQNGSSSLTEGLRASATAETNKDTYSWKKFRTTPSITIEYNTTPTTPTNLTTDGSANCATGADRVAIGTTTPTLRATVSDPDNTMKARFEWWALDGTAALGEYLTPDLGGGTATTAAATVPSGVFTNGSIARWRVRAEDTLGTSEWSAWCEFAVDTSRPPNPTITSTAFPDNADSTAQMGTALSVTFGAGGSPDVVSYEYVLNADSTVLSGKATPATAGGSVTVSVLPDRFVNWIHARSVDAAGNRSDLVTKVFYANSASAPVADWPMDDSGAGTVAKDSSPNHLDATLYGGASFKEGRDGGALTLNGSTAYAATSTMVVDTLKSFSVAGWVRLTDNSRNHVIATQVGSRASAFTLYYSSSFNKWIFNRTTSDVDSPTFVRAISTTVPIVDGRWTHLAGVYDATAKTIRLYVNGVMEAETSFTSPWASTTLQIGRSKLAGAGSEYWAGEIDGLQVHNRVLLPGEVQQVARLDGRWLLDETTGSTANDAAGSHPATWSASGVSRITGVTGNAVQLNGSTGTLTTSGPVHRTDGSFTVAAWVRADAVSRAGVALSQDGNAVSGFTLGVAWDSMAGGYVWSVRMPGADSLSASSRAATDPFDMPVVGRWTHLAAVYDAKQRQLRLYVDGQFVGDAYQTSAWNASGAYRIGSGRTPNTSAATYWPGAVDDVQAYSGVLSDQQIYALFNSAAE